MNRRDEPMFPMPDGMGRKLSEGYEVFEIRVLKYYIPVCDVIHFKSGWDESPRTGIDSLRVIASFDVISREDDETVGSESGEKYEILTLKRRYIRRNVRS